MTEWSHIKYVGGEKSFVETSSAQELLECGPTISVSVPLNGGLLP